MTVRFAFNAIRRIGNWCAAPLCLVAIMINSAHSTTITWATNLNGSWHSSLAWSPASIPTSGDDVVVRNNGTANVLANATARDLTVGRNYQTGTVNVGSAEASAPAELSVYAAALGDLDARGIINVTGAMSALNVSEVLHVGYWGLGELRISSGAIVRSGSAQLGTTRPVSSYRTAEGEVTISGANSRWENSGNLFVGFLDRGQITIQNGGTLTSAYAEIGHDLQSFGSVGVNGQNSRWTNSGALYVGKGGEGFLSVGNGGAVTASNAVIGYSDGSRGGVTIDGDNSSLSLTGSLHVGYADDGTLTIVQGGQVVNALGTVASAAGKEAEVAVSGAGSSWTSAQLQVGARGNGKLSASYGGAVSFQEAYIGVTQGANGQVNIAGEGSTFTGAATLSIGHQSQGSVTIRDGATASAGYTVLGYGATGKGTLKVTGENSEYTSSGLIVVGSSGQGTLEVSDGGFVSASSDSGGLLILPTGTVRGDGFVVARAVRNQGAIAPFPSSTNSLIIGPILANEPGATIRMSIESASSYSSLLAAGSLMLNGGTLAVEFAAGFVPVTSMSFDFLNWLSLTGSFTDITLPAVPAGFTWDTSQLYVDGVISLNGGAPPLPGDFDRNGNVDSADYQVWKQSFGDDDPLADANSDGIVDAADYTVWRDHYGVGSANASQNIAAVPEASGLILVAAAAIGGGALYRRRFENAPTS